MTYFFFILSTISCFITYLLFTNVELYSRSFNKVVSILYCDAAFILILLLLGSHKIVELWANRHKKGSRITLRLILLFSLASVLPSVLMTFFSAFFFHNGIDSWFNERNKTVLRESLNVAESYLEEHKQRTLNDCFIISKTLEHHIVDQPSERTSIDGTQVSKNIGYFIDDLCALKGINCAILLNNDFNVIARSKYSVKLHFLNINKQAFQNATERDAAILKTKGNNDETSIISLSCFKNINNEYVYLIIEKKINSNIVFQTNNARTAYNEYQDLLKERKSLEIAFILMFLIVGILLLVASIVIAILYSWKIVNPISNLIDVSESIISGNFNARVKEVNSYEEVSILIKTFNQMIDQIYKQQKDLEEINKRLDERIKFSTGVLAGVSSGVIGIDNMAVYVWNSAAEKLLNNSINFGEHILNIIPELRDLFEELEKDSVFIEKEIKYKKKCEDFIFSVKIENISTSVNNSRFVITFDDLTNMVITQRKAAWSEVARRVAHEIKNPLTPIQLSAERIRRKYLSQINLNKETFNDLIDVIIRQVNDIKRLTDDFSFFARLPNPVFKNCNIHEISKQAIVLMQNATTDIDIKFESEKNNYLIKADEGLLHQCIVNLIQNAINALNTTEKDDKKICVSIENENQHVFVSIEDNGPGLPKDKIESLGTPYFTMMPKGTGLGLSIVQKIIQDHNGELLFNNSETYGGAKVQISIPIGDA